MPAAVRLTRWVRAAAPDAEQITVRLVTQAEGRGLNLAYRGKDYATNVLTFPYEPGRSGDIVLCPAVIAREARAQRKSLDAHYAHLAIHGVLHLRGHDHERAADAVRMERMEIALLKRFGYANPYRA
jgi:probable rRNA maturation factor